MASVSKRKWDHAGKTKIAWVLRYVDNQGSRRAKTFPTMKEAEAARREIEAQLTLGQSVVQQGDATVKDTCEEFIRKIELRTRDRSISKSRWTHYKSVIDKHLVPLLGGRNWRSLSTDDAEALHQSMSRNGIAPVTARTYLGSCVTIERYARRKKKTDKDVFAEYMKERPKGEAQRIRTFTTVEARSLIAVASVRGPLRRKRTQAFYECAVNLAAFCGLRRGEILGLTRSNIDLDAGFIRVRHNLDRYDVLKGPKTKAGTRDVPIPKHVSDLLARWIEKHAVTEKRGLIFRTEVGLHHGSGNFNQGWQALLRRTALSERDAEGRTFHFHALRHFAASYMIECGWSLPEVAALLGHSTFDMTLQTYAHAVAGGKQRCDRMQAMASRLLGPAGGIEHRA